jgi:hypothetical protein
MSLKKNELSLFISNDYVEVMGGVGVVSVAMHVLVD